MVKTFLPVMGHLLMLCKIRTYSSTPIMLRPSSLIGNTHLDISVKYTPRYLSTSFSLLTVEISQSCNPEDSFPPKL